jgi:glycosyltransferase involved in cell wall biosynthesis/2-polyprenyl-3-methyl-5-hydroxy-6-metoxy-1,4-benzoquinol methylase
MRIVIATEGLEFDGDTLKKKSIGGSETAVISLANSLHKLGHEITVYNRCPQEGFYDGVEYINISRWDEFANCGYADVAIVSRFVQMLNIKLNTKLNILWNHDMMPDDMKNIVIATSWNYDYMYCLSQYHKDHYLKQLPELAPILKTTTNGIDFDLLPKDSKKKHRIMFTSRPERGLYRALLIYEQLGDKDLEFLICAYASFQNKEVEQIEKICADKINQLVADGFNIAIGSFHKKELYEYIAESKAVIYPTSFPEIFCISALEAQACGTAYLTTDDFALNETMAYKGIKNPESKDYDAEFLAYLKQVLSDDVFRDSLQKLGLDHSKKYSWDSVAKQFIADIEAHFVERSKDVDGIIDRLIYESDLVVAREIAKKEAPRRLDQLNHLLRHMDTHESQKEIYEEEKKHEKIDLEMKTIDTIGRFKWCSEMVKKHNVKTLLDFACHMGGNAIKVSNDNPDCKVTGFDLSHSALLKAGFRTKTHARHIDNLTFTKTVPDVKFDAVFNGEMLEHVLDPESMIDQLEGYVKQGGKMFITVPKGAWEWLSRTENKKMDVVYHINHFDGQDIQDMFGKKKDFKIMTLPVDMRGAYGERFGNYLIEYTVDGTPTGKRNFERKRLTTRPHQSISLCMIGKDAWRTIESTLDSIKDSFGNLVPDEIILVDDHSQDVRMSARAAAYGAVVYDLPQTITAPDYAGFAYARNYGLEKAVGKWILWVDTDELCRGMEFARKYLECPLNLAFVIKQYHPERDNYIEADTPQRLFKRGAGMFYGYIHEQAQADINKAIFPALILDEAEIWNMGSALEAERRHKTLDRNLPLLDKDWKHNVIEKIEAKQEYRKLTPILVIRDLLNRANWVYEKYGTYDTEEVNKRILPRLMQIYLKYCKDETDPIYRAICENIMQQVYRCLNIGHEIDLKIDKKQIKKRYVDLNELMEDIKKA